MRLLNKSWIITYVLKTNDYCKVFKHIFTHIFMPSVAFNYRYMALIMKFSMNIHNLYRRREKEKSTDTLCII